MAGTFSAVRWPFYKREHAMLDSLIGSGGRPQIGRPWSCGGEALGRVRTGFLLKAARWVVLISLMSLPDVLAAEEQPRLSWGGALTAGYRSPFLGGEALLSLPWGKLTRTTFHAGIGWLPDIQIFDSDPARDRIGWAAGIEGSWGGAHAGLLDVSVFSGALVDMDCSEGSSVNTEKELVPLVAVAGGYRYWFGSGIFVRLALGVNVLLREVPECSHFDRWNLLYDLAVGVML